MLLEGRGYRGWGIGVIKTIKYQGDGAGPVGGGQNSDMGVGCSSDYGDVWCGARGDVGCRWCCGWVVVDVVGVWEGCVGVLCWVWLLLWLGVDVAGCDGG